VNNLRIKPAHLWKPGQSGNPAGRPKGSLNKITMMRQVLEGELRSQLGPKMAEVLAKAIEMAMDGNEAMIKLLVDKTLPTSKGDDNSGEEQPKVQIMIGKLPERKEDITVNGEKV
jgi:hypothetical protein